MNAWIGVEFGSADVTNVSGQLLTLALQICGNHSTMFTRQQRINRIGISSAVTRNARRRWSLIGLVGVAGRICRVLWLQICGGWQRGSWGRRRARIGNGIGDLGFAHARQARDDLGVIGARRVGTAKSGTKDTAVGINGVVGDGMSQELQVDTNLVCAASQR